MPRLGHPKPVVWPDALYRCPLQAVRIAVFLRLDLPARLEIIDFVGCRGSCALSSTHGISSVRFGRPLTPQLRADQMSWRH